MYKQSIQLTQLCQNDYEDTTNNPNTVESFDDMDMVKNEDIYLTDTDNSESDNYGLPNYDNGGGMEFQYDDTDINRPFSDQPRKPPAKSGGRAAPISVHVEEKLWIIDSAISRYNAI